MPSGGSAEADRLQPFRAALADDTRAERALHLVVEAIFARHQPRVCLHRRAHARERGVERRPGRAARRQVLEPARERRQRHGEVRRAAAVGAGAQARLVDLARVGDRAFHRALHRRIGIEVVLGRDAQRAREREEAGVFAGTVAPQRIAILARARIASRDAHADRPVRAAQQPFDVGAGLREQARGDGALDVAAVVRRGGQRQLFVVDRQRCRRRRSGRAAAPAAA